MEAVLSSEALLTKSIVTDELSNKRLDQALAKIYNQYSRSRLQLWLAEGLVSLDGVVHQKGKTKVKTGSVITVDPLALQEQGLLQLDQDKNDYQPENLHLDIIYQDNEIIIINKPANLVVHPAAGNRTGTLVNGLLYHFPELAKMPRAGIVHRLDKDTTGLMVVARNLQAHHSLIKQLQAREVTRRYVALVNGHVIAGDTIETYMGRHRSNRLKMSVIDIDHIYADQFYIDQEQKSGNAKLAITHYWVLKKYRKHSLLDVKLSTGRTHQIRVHMSHIGYPIVGDKLYGRTYALPKEFSEDDQLVWQNFDRQALAAVELGFVHPATDEYVSWKIDIPEDMQELVKILDFYQ